MLKVLCISLWRVRKFLTAKISRITVQWYLLPWLTHCGINYFTKIRIRRLGHTEKVSVSTNITQNFMGRRAVFFLQIFYTKGMIEANIFMIVVNVSDADKRPCSIDKSDASRSLQRWGRHCTSMYYVCMRAYEKFSVVAWKSLQSALKNTVGRVSRNRDFFRFFRFVEENAI